MTVTEAFSANLRRILKERGLTRQQLANMSGVAQGTISNLTARKSGPTLYTAWLICRALNITLDDMVKGADT